MVRYLVLLSSIVLLLSACKKEAETPINKDINWKLGPNVYSGTYVTDSISGSWYAFASNSMFIVNFHDSLITGNYSLVLLPDSAFEMNITVSNTINGNINYYSTKSNTIIKTLVYMDTLNRRVIHVPELWAYNVVNARDSLKISGIITK